VLFLDQTSNPAKQTMHCCCIHQRADDQNFIEERGKDSIRAVNFIKARALKSRIFTYSETKWDRGISNWRKWFRGYQNEIGISNY